MAVLTLTLNLAADGRPTPLVRSYQMDLPVIRRIAETITVGGGTLTIGPLEGIATVQAIALTFTQDVAVQWTTNDPATGSIPFNAGGALVLLGTAITATPILFITNQGADPCRIRGVIGGLP